MRKLLSALSAISVAVLCLTLTIAPASTLRAAASDCITIYHLDTDPDVYCAPDLYYTELTTVPDWCAYQQGDHVFLKFDHNIPNPPIQAYYFVEAAYWDATAPPGFDPWGFYVVNDELHGCTYVFF